MQIHPTCVCVCVCSLIWIELWDDSWKWFVWIFIYSDRFEEKMLATRCQWCVQEWPTECHNGPQRSRQIQFIECDFWTKVNYQSCWELRICIFFFVWFQKGDSSLFQLTSFFFKFIKYVSISFLLNSFLSKHYLFIWNWLLTASYFFFSIFYVLFWSNMI